MLLHYRRTCSCLILSIAFATGCSEEAAQSTSPAAAKKPAPVPASKVALESSSTKDKDKVAKKAETVADAPTADEKTRAKVFVPPYQNRVELFVPVGRRKTPRAKTGGGGEDLKLNGFVTVEGGPLLAALVINGEQVHLRVGESFGGVEVVAIDPPNVTLKRGRLSFWKVTIANLDEVDEE